MQSRNIRELLTEIDAFSKYWNKLITETVVRYGISVSRFIVMGNLGHNERLTLTEIADLLIAKKSTVTEIVDTMEQDGLVRRVRDTRDRRKIFLELTEKGRALNGTLHGEMVPEIMGKTEDILSCLPEEDIEAFFRSMKILNSQLKRQYK